MATSKEERFEKTAERRPGPDLAISIGCFKLKNAMA